MVKVSVIVPVYNGEKTIRACIDSLLNQSMKDIEVIVVNDGSDDNTLKILNSYDDRIILINQSNAGQGAARNTGIKAAKGEYIGFADADDTVRSDMYQSMYELAKKDRCELVQCGIHDIKEDGTESDRAAFEASVTINDRADYIFEYFYHNKHTFEMCNKLVKKSFLEENSLSFSDTKKYFAEDLKLNAEMLLYLKKICFTDKCYYNYNIKYSGHCLNDLTGRIPKVIDLFEEVLSRRMETDVRKSLECTAALILLLYCRAVAETEPLYAAGLLRNKTLRRYVKTSMLYRSGFKHFCLYLFIYCFPPRVVLFILNIFMRY